VVFLHVAAHDGVNRQGRRIVDMHAEGAGVAGEFERFGNIARVDRQPHADREAVELTQQLVGRLVGV
jgi:hypothetical protein